MKEFLFIHVQVSLKCTSGEGMRLLYFHGKIRGGGDGAGPRVGHEGRVGWATSYPLSKSDDLRALLLHPHLCTPVSARSLIDDVLEKPISLDQ